MKRSDAIEKREAAAAKVIEERKKLAETLRRVEKRVTRRSIAAIQTLAEQPPKSPYAGLFESIVLGFYLGQLAQNLKRD